MIIAPKSDSLTEPYWAGAREGKLMLQHCRACSHLGHPPTPICARCQSSEIDWRPASGDGTVHTFTIVRKAVHVAMEGRVPYAVVVVQLLEGPRVIGNILDCALEDIAINMPVKVVFSEIAPGVTLPQFAPA